MLKVIAAMVVVAACAPTVVLDVDLQHANIRVPNQTLPQNVLVFDHDLDDPYDVLADLEVTLRQSSAFGEKPTRDQAVRILQERAGRIGAHAVVLVDFGHQGMSWWSYSELKGHGRAIRFR
jgi:hypothetical protein